MKSVQKILALVLCAVLVFSMTACAGGDKKNDPTGLSVDPAELTLSIGESRSLAAIVEGENADPAVTWASSDSAVVAVDENGSATGVSAGSATITATTANGAFSASCEVTVTEDVVEELFRLEYNSGGDAPTITTAVFYSNHQINVSANVGGAYTLAYDTEISMDEALVIKTAEDVVATVTEELKDLAAMIGLPETIVHDYIHDISVSEGSIIFEIVGPAEEGDPVYLGKFVISPEQVALLGFDLSSMEKVAVEGISFEESATIIYLGMTKELPVNIAPENATDKTVRWESSDPSIVSVDENGKLTSWKEGDVYITATTVDGGYTAKCLIRSIDPIGIDMTFNEDGTVDVYATISLLGIIVEFDYTTNYRVEDGVLKIDNTPYVAVIPFIGSLPLEVSHPVAVNEEGVTIAPSASGTPLGVVSLSKEEAEAMGIDLNKVVIPVENITLSAESLQMTVGDEQTLVATVTPDDASDKTVIWASTDDNIASVVDGKITANGAGLVFITASSADGSKSAACMVSVSAPAGAGTSMVFSMDDTVTVNTTITVDGVPYAISYTTTYTYADGVLSIANGATTLMGFIPVTVVHSVHQTEDSVSVSMVANDAYDAGSYTLTPGDMITVIM